MSRIVLVNPDGSEEVFDPAAAPRFVKVRRPDQGSANWSGELEAYQRGLVAWAKGRGNELVQPHQDITDGDVTAYATGGVHHG